MHRERYPINQNEVNDDRLMRDGLAAAFDEAESDGSLHAWLAEPGSSLMLAAVAGAMRARREKHTDRLLNQIGIDPVDLLRRRLEEARWQRFDDLSRIGE